MNIKKQSLYFTLIIVNTILAFSLIILFIILHHLFLIPLIIAFTILNSYFIKLYKKENEKILKNETNKNE